MPNFAEPVLDRLTDASEKREGITLDAQEVTDLVDEIPDEEEVMEHWIQRLKEVDVKSLKITKKACQAIADALEIDNPWS